MSTEEKAPSETQLYVSNLPFTYTDENLKEIFKDFKVRKAYVATRRNGRSKGFGFVDLESASEQAAALEAVNDLELDGRKLFVSVAHQDERRDESGVIKEEFRSELPPKKSRGGGGGRGPREPQEPSETIIYVANIPFEYEEKDLEELFKAHNVVSSRVARRRNDRSKGFAFVELATHADQQAALALDGHQLKAGTDEERIISVKVSVVQTTEAPAPRNEGGRNGGGRNDGGRRREETVRDPEDDLPSEIAVYVSNIPFDLTDEQLGEVFSSRGVQPARAHVARRRGNDRSKGFGFVVFNNNADQLKALEVASEVTLGDRELNVKVARKGSEKAPEDRPRRRTGARRGRGGEGAREPREPREPREKRPSQTLVYVSNLSFDIDDDQLALIFDGLKIVSAHVARRHNSRSKGFGFVEFASHEEQTKALAKSGQTVQDREISVEIANETVEKSE